MRLQMVNTKLFIAITIFSIASQAELREKIVKNPKTGNYDIYYISENKIEISTYVPENKLNLVVQSKYSFSKKNQNISYSFNIKNSLKSKQGISSATLYVADFISAKSTDKKWQTRYPPTSNSLTKIVWRHPLGQNIPLKFVKPGQSMSGLAVTSTALPGVGMISISGGPSPILSFYNEGLTDQKLEAKLDKIRTDNSRKQVITAIPLISTQGPPDVALSLLKNHLDQMVKLKQLHVDFKNKLSPYFDGAIASLEQGNIKTAIQDLKAILKLIKKKSKIKRPLYGISKLANEVLTFDLKFIIKNIKKDTNDDDSSDD